MLPPDLPLVRAVAGKPLVGDFVLGERFVNLDRAAVKAVFLSAADPEQAELLIRGGGVLERAAIGGLEAEVAERAAERADPGEFVEIRQARPHRLAAAHRQTRKRAVFAIRQRPEFAVDERD